MTAAAELLPGFADPVHDSQRVFRAAMQALSRPGSVHELSGVPTPPSPLLPAAAALLLALADHETPVWLDPDLAANAAVAGYVRFHTGASITSELTKATFVVVSAAGAMPPLEAMPVGTLEYPDRSATVIMQVEKLTAGKGWQLRGPGIATVSRLCVEGGPRELLTTMARNRTLFPRGIDILLAARDRIAGLPRTTIIEAERPTCTSP